MLIKHMNLPRYQNDHFTNFPDFQFFSRSRSKSHFSGSKTSYFTNLINVLFKTFPNSNFGKITILPLNFYIITLLPRGSGIKLYSLFLCFITCWSFFPSMATSNSHSNMYLWALGIFTDYTVLLIFAKNRLEKIVLLTSNIHILP